VACASEDNHNSREVTKSFLNKISGNECGKDSSICPSTAYEDCETPGIASTLMWEPYLG
jgi:hypothetical protein